MKTVKITINWDNLKSIKSAERKKARLENQGYSLNNQYAGLFYSVLIYSKAN